jgi:hypothetical protein
MGAVSCTMLRISGKENLIQGPDDVMAVVGPEDVHNRRNAVCFDILGTRFSLFHQDSGRAIA